MRVGIELRDPLAGLCWPGLGMVETGRGSGSSITDSLWELASSGGKGSSPTPQDGWSGTGPAGSSVIILVSSSSGEPSGTRGSSSAEQELDRLVSLDPKSDWCIMERGSEPGEIESGDGSSVVWGTVLGERLMGMGAVTCLLPQVSYIVI
jgi:hypothetical protein